MKFSPKAKLLSFLLLGVLLAAPAGYAQSSGENIVRDGDFEQAAPGSPPGTEYFSFFQPFDTHWVIALGTAGIDAGNAYVYGGMKSLFLNTTPAGGTASVFQELTSTGDQPYILSFYADTDAADPLLVSFGSQIVGGGPLTIPMNGFAHPGPAGFNASRFTFFSFDVTAASPTTSLMFTSTRSNQGTIELDDITVTPRTAFGPVPEASTAASLGLLLAAGLGCAIRTTRKKLPVS